VLKRYVLSLHLKLSEVSAALTDSVIAS